MKPIQIGDVVGDYQVIDIAGSGGMGAVYKIEHLITKRIEAMKLLPPASTSDPEQVLRFEREIQVQARLHHPNIVALYNAVRFEDATALVMEFVEGESLQRKLEAGPLPVDTALDFAGQVLCALAYAHEAGVIHRDVAPANIIITPERLAKLSDFGLARGATDLRLSTSGVPVGSPWYMSPEQVRAIGPMDARTDVYATGAVLHEMLTGAKLFEAEGAFAVMRAHVEATPAPPSSRNPAVSPALDEIVCKAVAKDPAMRFQSADEFRLALQNIVAEVPPVVLPSNPPPAERSQLLQLASQLHGLLPSRAAVMLAVVPVALVAGYLRLVPVAGNVHAPTAKPLAVAPSQPIQPPPALQPQAPPPPPVAAVEDNPPEVEKPVVIVRHRAPVPAQTTQRLGKPRPNYAIRVTGTESLPLPAVRPAPRASVEAPEPPATESVALPEEPPSLAASAPPAPPAPPKPSSVGSRLVRALGKVNPFHRNAKRDPEDAVKTPLKKDGEPRP